ncbi:TrbI/VirB10 family protein [Pelagerythrobacter aerophilus]|uniref:TrbI/VirB10 family protein n=1 Tax=Pelagerythrobacter aerophilus TaxID=2306995 RepID=A0A418NL34_9SPHN|nr:TrbI/VirB10 family protein [Pelagerythrobacter aerophilus]RIV80349.1 TrbI/VirB10 family protein [Pelagerythrobacter aerophilus]
MSDETQPLQEGASPSKVDPEALVLRGTPGRVVRFRRGAIIAIAAFVCIGIAGTAWIALKPPSFRIVASEEDLLGATSTNPASDALAGAPESYGDVPQLGPPLPGDLGGPILEHQRSLGIEDAELHSVDQAEQAAEAERQRIVAERRAARESSVMIGLANGAQPSSATVEAGSAAPLSPDPQGNAGERLALDRTNDPAGQQRKTDFLAQGDDSGDINPHRLAEPVSPYTLMAGSVVAASLITGLDSDLPGLVTAQVTENTFDSVTGRSLLIPQGSRLIGSYDSVVAFGQRRALVVWQRVILPDGTSIGIDNVPATDTQGYAGLADTVDLHTWQLLKGVGLSTLLGVGTELSFGSSESDLVRALRESAQQSGARAGDRLVTRNLDVQPTIRVRPGWPLRIVVHKDIVLRPWVWAGG